MSCPITTLPEWKSLVSSRGEDIAYYLWDLYEGNVPESEYRITNFKILDNAQSLNLTDNQVKTIYDNYVNLMDRKREGKSIDLKQFGNVLKNLQVFEYNDTYIFGEWDVKNNVFKGRLMSSPNIRQLFNSLDVLFNNVDFVASVPSDIGVMLEKKGLYKLDVGKAYNFKGEDMVKNLYFSSKELVKKIFKTEPENVTIDQVKRYDEFFNYKKLISDLKTAYELKENDKLFSILKDLGIYDYNAYKLVKKIKQNKITQEDAVDVIQQIIKNSSNNKVNIDKTDLINQPKIYNELDTELNKILASYLSKFGIKTQLLENLQDDLGIDSYATVDILNKIIYADKNNQEDYPQQAGKLIAFMMQHNPLVSEIMNAMKNQSIFKNLSKDELFDAVGDLISQELHKKTNTALPKTLIDSIKSLIRQFLNFLNSNKLNRINKNIGIITENILIQNQSLITQSTFKPGAPGKKLVKVSFQEALNKDKFATAIVDKMSSDFILGGSISFSEQGTVLRPDENQVHDLDWASPHSRKNTKKIFEDLYPEGQRLYIREIPDEESNEWTDTWLLTEEGHTIKNLQFSKDGKNKVIGYDIVNNETNKVVSQYVPQSDSHTGEVVAKPIDIFSSEEGSKEKYPTETFVTSLGTNVKLGNWRASFEAKLRYGRLKDIWDYNRFIPDEQFFNREITVNKNPSVLLQTKDMSSSKASEETVAMMRKAAEQMGIDIQDLLDYAKANPDVDVKNINGLADLIKGVVAVSQGMESQALTEEIVHIATAMIEQTDPKLVTEMISKIDRFAIYKKVLNEYKNNKAYQLADGRPNIRKIKKEAVDKLLTEVIINKSEGSTEFPELMQEENRNIFRRLWDALMDRIKDIYRKSNIDIFETVGEKIAKGEVEGDASNLNINEIYYQINDSVKKRIDDYYNIVVDIDNRMVFNEETATDKRHYKLDDKRVAMSVTEKVKGQGKQFETTPELQKEYDQYANWGSDGHSFIENDMLKNLIDKDGYAKKDFTDVKITTDLNIDIQDQLSKFTRNLVRSYPEGTRFLIERKVVNTKVKGLLGSRIDFKAVYPFTKKDGTQGIKIDNLDWKFTKINKETDQDINPLRQKEWKSQMGEYTKMDYSYGAKYDEIGRNRMIPFILNYDYVIPGSKKSGVVPTSIEIGNLNSLEETNLYLLPVPIATEATGNPKVDALLKTLNSYYNKLWQSPVATSEKSKKERDLNELSAAIRQLHLQLNFGPLASVGKTFLENAAKNLKEFESLDFTQLDEAQTRERLKELDDYNQSAEKFANIDEVFLSQYDKDTLSEDDRKILRSLKNIKVSAQGMEKTILGLRQNAVAELLVKEGLIEDTEKDRESILQAEAEVTNFAKTWSEASALPVKLIKYATNLLLVSKKATDMKFVKMMNQYEKILIPLDKEAKAKGKTAFDMIGKVRDGNLSLIQKIDPEFYKQLKKAKEDKDIQFILNNIDLEKYNTLAKEQMDRDLIDIETREFSTDETTNRIRKEAAIKRLRNSLDITSSSFNGYQSKVFGYILKQSLNLDKHQSKEYTEMAKSENALNVWKWFNALNEKAYDMGYISDQGLSFFPLMEATTLQKLSKGENKIEQLQDFFGNLYKVQINEEQGLSKIDPETGEVKKTIPKYFTRTNKSLDKLSTDLNKVGTMWMKALLDYENSKDLEYTMISMLAVEKAKGSLVLGPDGNVIFENGSPLVSEKESKNSAILEAILNDNVYRLNEDVNSAGNLVISDVTGKFKTEEESKQKTVVNVKKTIRTADAWVQSLAVGLKPLIAFANWSGFQFQAFINGGTLYTFKEFEKNNALVSFGRMSLVQKALVDQLVPLNEDVVTYKLRGTANKLGVSERLSSWSFNDVMMSTNAFPERLLQYANALSFYDNSMVVDGKIVNIRQYIKEKDGVYEKDTNGNFVKSASERRALEKSLSKRVQELQKTSSITNTAKIVNDELVIEGVSEKELAKFAVSVTEYARRLNGQMSQENKAAYKRDTMFNSFMMFKHWIPKLVGTHAGAMKENLEIGDWQYGRTRAFLKTVSYIGFRNIGDLNDIIQGTEKGLRILSDLLEAKKEEHFKKTGQILDITEEEFYDMMRNKISEQFKELGLLISMLGLLFTAAAAKPPEDATALEKNRYKFWAKLINKVSDEITFYYNPLSAESITKGSLVPSLGLLAKAGKIIKASYKLGVGEITDDEKMIETSDVPKYIFNLIPIISQLQTEVLPYINPELAREMGIRVTAEARRQ
jgi:hypothetical protein